MSAGGSKKAILAALTANAGIAVDEAESRIRAAVPTARIIYLEPDLYREPAGKA